MDHAVPDQDVQDAAGPDLKVESINIETVAKLIGRHPDLLLELLATVDDAAPQTLRTISNNGFTLCWPGIARDQS